MTTDDEALSWEGDEEHPTAATPAPRLRRGWKAVGKGSESVVTTVGDDPDAGTDAASDAAPSGQLGSGMLLAVGLFGGVYVLYIVGWVMGGLNLRPLALPFLADAFVTPWIVLAAVGTALWLPAVWLLTKGAASWLRIALLVVGAVLLVPWPFVMLGAVGS